MMGHFPTPYPDELLYSICARVQERMRFPRPRTALKVMFGTQARSVAIDLPCRLGHLVEQLPIGQLLTVDDLTVRTTLFPYYAPFLSEARMQTMHADMVGNQVSIIHRRMGMGTGWGLKSARLRLCRVCVATDRERYGECYRHRTHQAPGVEVCPIHAVLLSTTTVHAHGRGVRYPPCAAEQAVAYMQQGEESAAVNRADPLQSCLLWLAEQTAWLLDERIITCGPATLRRRYLQVLARRALMQPHGGVRLPVLRDHFLHEMPHGLLEQLESGAPRSRRSQAYWLAHLVYPTRHIQPPLRHLLFLRFLGMSARDMLAGPKPLLRERWLTALPGDEQPASARN